MEELVLAHGVKTTRSELLRERARRQAKADFATFFKLWPPRRNYLFGRHTQRLLRELQKTTEMVEQGQSRYLIVNIPPRHGKSDITSRRWPVWHELRNPDHEFMINSYNYSLASTMSYDCRDLMRVVGPAYGVSLNTDRSALNSWKLNQGGAVHASGIGGTITGLGADVMAIDDYYKNREEAESEVIRAKVQEAFESDMMTRLAPVHGVAIVANRWHDSDLVQWILNKNNPAHQEFDPDFPVFEVVRFPAWDESDGWLFEERFSDQYYRSIKSLVSQYAWNAQYQQDPVPRQGNLFRVDKINVVEKVDDFPDVTYCRFWDLASTVKERAKDDPDYTCGALVGIERTGERGMVNKVWIKDMIFVQKEAPERDRIIQETAYADGAEVRIGVESVAGYKDTWATLRSVLSGIRSVYKIPVSGDKLVNAQPLEAPMEKGNVHILRAKWNDLLLQQLAPFPNPGSHDDAVDAVAGAYRMACRFAGSSIEGFSRASIGF